MTKKYDWTVMVYLAGENNLSDECIYALKEMKRAISGDNVAVLAQFDSVGAIPTCRYFLKGGDEDCHLEHIARTVNIFPDIKTKKREIRKRLVLKEELQNRMKIEAKTPKNPKTGKTSQSADPDPLPPPYVSGPDYAGVLHDFICWGIRGFAAHRYMVVLSGHGSGADGDFLIKEEFPSTSFSIPELKKVFKSVRRELTKEGKYEVTDGKIDILGMDSCLMNMAEVAFEVRDYVKVLVGAEGFELNTGWPFQRILSDLFETTARGQEVVADVLARRIVKKYALYYSDYLAAGSSVDLSACDLSKAGDLARAINRLAEVLRARLEQENSNQAAGGKLLDREITHAILLAHWKAQSYKLEQYVDIYDFCDLLDGLLDKKETGNKSVHNACETVKQAVKNFVIDSQFSGPAVQHSHGVSIYFPWNRVSDQYKNLDFARKTQWDEFLNTYVEKTRRSPRNIGPDGKLVDLGGRPMIVTGYGVTQPNVRFIAPLGRFTIPIDRFTRPIDKGGNSDIASMKNPPDSYFKIDCRQSNDKKALVGSQVISAKP